MLGREGVHTQEEATWLTAPYTLTCHLVSLSAYTQAVRLTPSTAVSPPSLSNTGSKYWDGGLYSSPDSRREENARLIREMFSAQGRKIQGSQPVGCKAPSPRILATGGPEMRGGTCKPNLSHSASVRARHRTATLNGPSYGLSTQM